MHPTRRQFLGVAAGVAGAALAARSTFAQGANDRIGIALIGCGDQGGRLLEECLAARDTLNLEFPALCDVYRPSLKAAAARVKAATGAEPNTFTRYQDALADARVDAVIIATPDFSHGPMVLAAAEGRKHIYVEAPLTSILPDAVKSYDAVKAAGVVCQVGYQRRADPLYRGAAKLLEQGILGKVVECECVWAGNKVLWNKPWREVPQSDIDWEQFLMGMTPRPYDPRMVRNWQLYFECTSGLVGLFGTHLIDVATWLAGDTVPGSAVGMGAKIVWRDRDHMDTQESVLHYPTRDFIVRCSLRTGNAKRGPELTIYGMRGVFDSDSWTARGEGASAKPLAKPVKAEPIEGQTLIENWISCIRANDPATYADIGVGFNHAVATTMAASASYMGQRMQYFTQARKFRKGPGDRPKGPYDDESAAVVF